MSNKKFEYFHNHGDEEGNNSLTICYGDANDPYHIIVGTANIEEEAIEAVQRLNEILSAQSKHEVEEFKEKLRRMVRDQPYMLLVTKETIIKLIDEL